ncbi:MAG: carbohydrate kinase family protein [Verrucomicrobiota bacterium]|nr:carbohydrate kinase family protein [Verrucomicrobiota bacterium]
MNSPELREQCAQKLLAGQEQIKTFSAFIGLDGFVDEIIHVVNKRQSAEKFERLTLMRQLAERILGAAGKSTNIELAVQQTKLGGNGPIMANALAVFGVKVTYLGALGYPTLHPLFQQFAQAVQVHSLAEPGHTDALEFDDGKIMLGKMEPLKEVNWENIQGRFGRENFANNFCQSDLVAFVNWTMIPYMSDLWESLQKEICPSLPGARRKIFFDLADPEKRNKQDILRAMNLISGFEKYFEVILGLNEKEAYEISAVLGLDQQPNTPDGLSAMSRALNQKLKINTLVIHPVTYALATSHDVVDLVAGPFVGQPLITTGAGDHFNAGFCLGKMLGLNNALSVLTGVTTSGFYVRTAKSPTVLELAESLRHWKERE